jgi:ABC-2 type transport system ATP-binding protein
MIQVNNIRRTFRSTTRAEGFRGAFGLLLRPKYKDHEALKGVSFDIEPGSFTGLIGENGAGKTTLLKILSGLIPPTSGTATVLGCDPFKRSLDFRKKIALVMGQKAQLWWDLPATDAFDLLRAIYEIPNAVYRERLTLLSELLDVKEHLSTQIRRLSLGERMKMELIGAIIHWPKVIFLDEPTIGLDVLAAHKLREFLKAFNEREKATIILTSHNMDDIERLCSRVIILKSGSMIYDGKPEGLSVQGERRLKVRIKEEVALAELSLTTGVPVASIDQKSNEELGTNAIHFKIKQDEIVSVLQTLMKKYQIIDMGIEEASLESVIQKLYEGDQIPSQRK